MQMKSYTVIRQFSLAAAILVQVASAQAQKPRASVDRSSQVAVAKTYFQATSLIHNTPHILIAKTSMAPVLIAKSDLHDSAVVSSTSAAYFTNVVREILLVPENAEIVSLNTLPVGALWNSTYAIHYNGIPVRERVAHLTIGAITGKPMMVRSNLPTALPNTASASLTVDDAKSIALKSMPTDAVVSDDQPRLVYVHDFTQNELRLAYEMYMKQGDITTTRITIDAVTGKLLEQKELLEYDATPSPVTPTSPKPTAGITVHGRITAMVHATSPQDSLQAVPLESATIIISGKTLVTNANGEFSVDGVTTPYQVFTAFSGPHEQVYRKDGKSDAQQNFQSSDAELNITWTPANSDDAERNSFWAVNSVHDYVRSIDSSLKDLDKGVPVNINKKDQTCNAFYNPVEQSLNFLAQGGGCANTALIPDVVYHEFGHRVNHVRYRAATSDNMVDGSLNEGFADLNSAFRRDNSVIGKDFFGKGTTLRNTDNTKKWPNDLNVDIHESGQIISGAIWDVRKVLGLAYTQELYNKMGYLAPDGTNTITTEGMHDAYMNVLYAMLATDDNDNDLSNGTPHSDQIIEAFSKHNINLSDCMTLNVSFVPDQPATADSYPVHLNIDCPPDYGAVNDQSVTLCYSVNDGKTYASIPMQKVNDVNYTASIPKQAPGAIVQYYTSAAVKIQKTGQTQQPRPENAYSFVVGSTSPVFTDDMESDKGWTVSGSTIGKWVRDTPSGSEMPDGEIMQQDTNHTAGGSRCFVTGNSNASDGNRDGGTDPVRNGSQTLTSPTIDLAGKADPIVRFWYYYYTDSPVSNSPSTNSFQAMISNDNGSTWKTVASFTRSYSSRWLPVTVRVSNYLTPSSKMKIKFVMTVKQTNLIEQSLAGAQGQAIGEAGVDDIEILDAPAFDAVKASAAIVSSISLGEPYPNPSHHNVTIPYTLGADGEVTLEIKNVLGEVVTTPLHSVMTAGKHSISFVMPSSLAEGSYWVQLRTPTESVYKKITLSR